MERAAFITGAGGYIGAQTALTLAQSGYARRCGFACLRKNKHTFRQFNGFNGIYLNCVGFKLFRLVCRGKERLAQSFLS